MTNAFHVVTLRLANGAIHSHTITNAQNNEDAARKARNRDGNRKGTSVESVDECLLTGEPSKLDS